MSNDIITTDQYIANALKQYVPVIVGDKQLSPEEHIKSIHDYCSGLTIAGMNDKTGYDQTKAALSKVKKLRTAIEGKRKELKDVALKYGKAVDGEAKRLTLLIEPIEEGLTAKVKAIDDAAEAARKAEHIRRHNAMLEAGFYNSGGIYTAGPFNYSIEQVLSASEETLNEMLQRGRDEKERAEAERRRLEEQRIENERKAKELAEKEAELRRQADEMEAARNAAERPTPVMQDPPPPPPQVEQDPFANIGRTTVPPKNEPELEPVVRDSSYKAAFAEGFDACRNRILERLNDPTPISRGDLKLFIQQLQRVA